MEYPEICGTCEYCQVKWDDDNERFYNFCDLKLDCTEIDDWCENWELDGNL